jgi:hypothetical protein
MDAMSAHWKSRGQSSHVKPLPDNQVMNDGIRSFMQDPPNLYNWVHPVMVFVL